MSKKNLEKIILAAPPVTETQQIINLLIQLNRKIEALVTRFVA
jgi:restriction endonuclease S subunit